MRRRLFRLSTGLSVAALAAMLLLWVSSYYHCRLFSNRGRILLLVVKVDSGTEDWLDHKPPSAGTWENLLPRKNWQLGGVQIAGFRTINRYEYTYHSGTSTIQSFAKLHLGLLAVPYWLLVVVAAAAPVGSVVVSVRKRARRMRGRCAGCGYDLRASPERCPECGMSQKVLPTVPS